MKRPITYLRNLLSRPTVRALTIKTAWTIIWGVVSRTGTILALILAAGLLPLDSFGKLANAQLLVTCIAAIIAPGTQIYLIQRFASIGFSQSNAAQSTRIAFECVGFFGLGTLAFAFIAPGWIASVGFGDPELEQIVLITIVWAIGGTFEALAVGSMLGQGREKLMTVSGATHGVALVATVSLGTMSYGLYGALVAFCLCAWIVPLIYCLRSRVLFAAALVSRPEGTGIGRYSQIFSTMVPASLAGVLWTWGQLAANASVVHSAGSHLETAHFAIGMQFFSALHFLPQMAGVAVLSSLTRLQSSGRTSDAIKVASTGSGVVFVLAALVGGILYLAAPQIMSFLGPKYAEAQASVGYAGIALMFAAPMGILGQTFVSLNRLWTWVFISAVGGLSFYITAEISAGSLDAPLSLGLIVANFARAGLSIAFLLVMQREKLKTDNSAQDP